MPDRGIKVGTVEEFQGQERKVILMTTVRTNANYINCDLHFNLGFLRCEKRMNVAISRARALLVVFGKESILGQDNCWNHLIQHTKNMGTYVSVWTVIVLPFINWNKKKTNLLNSNKICFWNYALTKQAHNKQAFTKQNKNTAIFFLLNWITKST